MCAQVGEPLPRPDLLGFRTHRLPPPSVLPGAMQCLDTGPLHMLFPLPGMLPLASLRVQSYSLFRLWLHLSSLMDIFPNLPDQVTLPVSILTATSTYAPHSSICEDISVDELVSSCLSPLLDRELHEGWGQCLVFVYRLIHSTSSICRMSERTNEC